MVGDEDAHVQLVAQLPQQGLDFRHADRVHLRNGGTAIYQRVYQRNVGTADLPGERGNGETADLPADLPAEQRIYPRNSGSTTGFASGTAERRKDG